MKKIAILAIISAMVLATAGVALASKPKTVWEDDEGDADMSQGLGGSIPGGFDLLEGTIRRDKENLEFTVVHADMPPFGTVPEAFRFLWSFMVDGEPYRLTVKRADIGKPDVAAGQTTDRVGRVDLDGHFRLEGECVTEPGVGVSFVNCPPLEYLEGVWEPADGSFTVVVPMESIGAKTRSKISAGPEVICVICWVTHYAERSLSTSVIDSAGMTTVYKVPKK